MFVESVQSSYVTECVLCSWISWTSLLRLWRTWSFLAHTSEMRITMTRMWWSITWDTQIKIRCIQLHCDHWQQQETRSLIDQRLSSMQRWSECCKSCLISTTCWKNDVQDQNQCDMCVVKETLKVAYSIQVSSVRVSMKNL